MPVQRPPRARSAAGEHPPRIATQAWSYFRACIVVADALSCCDAYGPTDIQALLLLPSLRTFVDKEWSTHLRDTCAAFIDQHYAEHRAARSGTRSGTWRRMSGAEVGARIDEEIALADPGLSIDAAVELMLAAGLDGELLVSEVIVRETNRHTGLIHKEISKLRGSMPDTDPADLMGFAWRGLRVALRQYDPNLGWAFSTFACPKINGAIRDGIRSEHHLPKRLTTYVRKLSAAEEHLSQALQRTPTFGDIEAYLDGAGASLDIAPRLVAPVSLEARAGVLGAGERELACLVDSHTPEDAAVAATRRDSVRAALASLDEPVRELMILLFFDELTLTAAARRMNIELRAARAMRELGVAELRLNLDAWSPATLVAAA